MAPMPDASRRLLRLLLCSLCLGLLACETEEEEELRSLQRRLDLELAEQSEIAQNLNERRREAEVVQEQMALHCAPAGSPALLSQVSALLPGAQVSVREEQAPKVWLQVKGVGAVSAAAEAVNVLAKQAPFLALEQVSAEKGAWTLGLRAEGPCPPPGPYASGSSSRPALPPRGWFKTNKILQLRESIAQTEARIAQLALVTGEIGTINRQKLWAERVLTASRDRPDGLPRQAPLVQALFAVPDTFSGTLRVTGGETVYEGRLPLEEPDWTARLLQAGFRVGSGEGPRRVLLPREPPQMPRRP